jgi:NAD(P)-dependent dehydrogenase (short-subunit alcohol dehydrogenase family)
MANEQPIETAQRVDQRTSLQGLRAVITGGTAGLGLALVRELHAHGASVAFVARTRSRVRAVEQELPGVHGIVGDVASKEDIHRIALQVLGRLGGVDVLINNASELGPTPLRLLADTQCEDLEQVFATNVLGPFRLTKALLGALAASAREARGAVVLNVSSDAAINAYARWGAYGGSKAALVHLTRIWNEELSVEGVKLLALDPGDMDTLMHARALPDADPTQLKQPVTAAAEFIGAIMDLLPERQLSARKAS